MCGRKATKAPAAEAGRGKGKKDKAAKLHAIHSSGCGEGEGDEERPAESPREAEGEGEAAAAGEAEPPAQIGEEAEQPEAQEAAGEAAAEDIEVTATSLSRDGAYLNPQFSRQTMVLSRKCRRPQGSGRSQGMERRDDWQRYPSDEVRHCRPMPSPCASAPGSSSSRYIGPPAGAEGP
ncbi:unnamed protein product [Vitrella brassicaformis CCMP3155]|uniref:Uncharacterized protein n=1 Tax=Vitrella brassicaformis (strain CCMP3155) TaxID=1169540 RepID=A0A0G4ECE3_VITBC|nr:unnamed protein product [Vitrella brassicaformis CCMP3155]|eukprot:CEL93606.1 unnamed protein product [Vitrella brassicaformis CCMP3155]